MIRSHSSVLVHPEGIHQLTVHAISMFLPVVLPPQSFFDLLLYGIVYILSKLLSSCYFSSARQVFALDVVVGNRFIKPHLFSFLVFVGNVTSVDDYLSVYSILRLFV